MKLGDVLKKERENKGLSVEETAGHLSIPTEEYERMEAGESPAERWGPVLAQIAIELETPTSRLLADSGRFEDTAKEKGQAGALIRKHREKRGKSEEEMVEAINASVRHEYRPFKRAESDSPPEPIEVTPEDYRRIEAGESELEVYGPRFLGFAEAIEQPVFNLFYPCGLPYQELEDYP